MSSYVWSEQADEDGRHHAGDGAQPVDQRHDGAGVVLAQVEAVDAHARVEGPHAAHADGEEHHDQRLVAARVGCADDAQCRDDRRCGPSVTN